MLEKDDMMDLINTCAAVVEAHTDELTELDSAIGDGDHGYNMKRGFEALRAEADVISEKPFPDALTAAGMKLVMTVGGALFIVKNYEGDVMNFDMGAEMAAGDVLQVVTNDDIAVEDSTYTTGRRRDDGC